MRFFKSTDGVYEQARAALDAAWGLPNASGTATCIEPAATAPRDDSGQLLLAVDDEFCSWEPAATMLPQMLDSGSVIEITLTQYRSATEVPDPLQG